MRYKINAIDSGKDALVSEQLAKTYFPSFSNKEEDAPPNPPKKRSIAYFNILFAILAVILISLFATRSITVDISIDKKGRYLLENLLYTAKPGLVGSSIIEDNGDSRYAVLINDGTMRRAALTIDFKKPVDISRGYILINSMPKKGGGRLRVILRDEGFRSYISSVLDIRGADNVYESFIVSAQDASRPVNIKRINQIRLELEKDREKTREGSCIYIKTVGIVNN